MKYSFLLLLLLFCLASCKVKRPSYVLTDSDMEEVLYDYHIAKAIGEERGRGEDYKRVLFTESVFRKHGITKADFDTSMAWFSRNPEVLSKIYEKVSTRLKAERDGVAQLIAMREEKPKEFASGDSVDVWAGRAIYKLTGMSTRNKLTFALTADTTFHPRDTLRWSVRFRFLEGKPDTLALPLMAMQVQYEKRDSIVAATRSVASEGTQTLTLTADTLGNIKEVRGFIYYSPSSSSPRPLWADGINLMRYHATDTLSYTPTDTLSHPADSLHKDIPTHPVELKPIENVESPGARGVRPIRPRPRR